MKLGREIPELGSLAVTLLRNELLAAIMEGGRVNQGQAEAIVAARVMLELPNVEDADGAEETLGWLVAAKVLGGRRLLIEANERGIALILGEDRVEETMLRSSIDFEYFAACHAEWKLQCQQFEVEYQLPESSIVCLRGEDTHWSRYEQDSE